MRDDVGERRARDWSQPSVASLVRSGRGRIGRGAGRTGRRRLALEDWFFSAETFGYRQLIERTRLFETNVYWVDVR